MNTAGDAPGLSVVVVMLGGRDYLPRCLDALGRQVGVARPEILVPCDASAGDLAPLRRRYPDVQFLPVAGRRTYAELRALGFQRARGTIIALTEDHCSPDPDWCQQILKLHELGHAAVGGAVDKGPDGILNWAVYLCDFSRYMNPVAEGPSAYLTDCNVAYKRRALEPLAPLWATEFHETTINWTLAGRGQSLWLSPRVIVRQQRSLTLGHALGERYRFGRLFARTRVAATPWPRRPLYAVGALALPLVLMARVARNVLAKRRARGRFLLALPAIALLNTVWGLGELVGYLQGTLRAREHAE
ncbi:MAG TPA: glycosyltransferase [Methylomirabilota bacterium]|nr:glycosyltransferase [Methylomirabilota bacterium]